MQMQFFEKSKLCFCGHKNRETEVSRLPESIGFGGGENLPYMTHLCSIMEKKTNVIKIRVSPSCKADIMRRSKPFGTLSNFMNQAIKEFSDTTSRERLEIEKNLALLYADIDAKLAHAGANLNQAMRRINETAQAGLDYRQLLIKQLALEVQMCNEVCLEIRNVLKDITYKTIKE